MEIKLELTFNQLLMLIRQLPKRDIKKLAHTLQSEVSDDAQTISLQELILKAPSWSDVDLKKYHEARDHINKSRIA